MAAAGDGRLRGPSLSKRTFGELVVAKFKNMVGEMMSKAFCYNMILKMGVSGWGGPNGRGRAA